MLCTVTCAVDVTSVEKEGLTALRIVPPFQVYTVSCPFLLPSVSSGHLTHNAEETLGSNLNVVQPNILFCVE